MAASAATASNQNLTLAEPLDYISPEEIVFDGVPLGSGGFGSVERGTWTGIPVAIKTLRLTNADADLADVRELQIQTRVREIKREVQIQQRLRDPRVCAVYGVFEKNDDEICIVMELAASTLHAKLLNAITAGYDTFPLRSRLTLLWQIAAVLERMHAKNKPVLGLDGVIYNTSFIHCDLKPHNILLMSDGTPKLADFGLSTIRHADTGQTVIGARRGQGTAEYLCPTLIRIVQERQSPGAYNVATDMYAFGVIMYEVLSGFRPYHALLDEMKVSRRAAGRGGGDAISPAEWSDAVMSVVYSGQRPNAMEVFETCVGHGIDPSIATSINEYMEDCWDSDASTRPSARVMANLLNQVLDAIPLFA